MLHLQYIRALITKARSEEGASAVEYGLLVAAIAALIVVIVFVLGNVIHGVFSNTCSAINVKAGSGSSCAG